MFDQELKLYGFVLDFCKKTAAEKVQLPGIKIVYDDDYVVVVE